MTTYIKDDNFYRFVARDKANPDVFYRVSQGGHNGQEIDYVRVDETLNVTIHEITWLSEDGKRFGFDPTPIDIDVTWT